MDGEAPARRRYRVAKMPTLTTVVAVALLTSWPAPARAYSGAVASDGVGSSRSAPTRAALPRLWYDANQRWVHQNATAFNVYVSAQAPNVRRWVAHHSRMWSTYTVLDMRLVDDIRLANVVVRVGKWGKRSAFAWTHVCQLCDWAVVYLNVDQIRRGFNRSGFEPFTPRATLATALCHELGHVAGLGHGGTDCMAFTYRRTLRTRGSGPASWRLINAAYKDVRTGLPRHIVARAAELSAD